MANAADDYSGKGDIDSDRNTPGAFGGAPGSSTGAGIAGGAPNAPTFRNGEDIAAPASILNDALVSFQSASRLTNFIVNGRNVLSATGSQQPNACSTNRTHSNAGSGEIFSHAGLTLQNDAGGTTNSGRIETLGDIVNDGAVLSHAGGC
jgi:hypothetical protein